MQFTTSALALAVLATSAFAAPAAGGPSARNVKAARDYCPGTVTVHNIAPDGTNNIYSVPVNGGWKDITQDGDHPELSISVSSWTDFYSVDCEFVGVDTKNNAPPVLANEVGTPFGPGKQVGPPQTLLSVSCTCS